MTMGYEFYSDISDTYFWLFSYPISRVTPIWFYGEEFWTILLNIPFCVVEDFRPETVFYPGLGEFIVLMTWDEFLLFFDRMVLIRSWF